MMTEPRRALLISPEFPYPPTSGGRQRTFHLLKALSELYQLDLLTFSEQARTEDRNALEPLCARVEVVALPHHPKTPLAFLRRNLSRAIRGVNPLIDRFSDPPVRRAVTAWLQQHRYDLILIEHAWIAHYIDEIESSHNREALTVLDAHNIESELWRQYYDQPPQWWHKPALYRYWRSALLYERRFLNRFDLVLAVSSSDATKIASAAPHATVRVLPNGIDLPPASALLNSAERARVIGFIGSLDYLPNQLGLEWFVIEVWPHVKNRVFNLQLSIIGGGLSKRLADLCQADENVRLVGYVDDPAPHLNRMAIMIVPLWHGSGTRIKILEAWAHGIPVVSTTRGAEGLDYAHMQNIWIADAPADFAAAVVYLMADQDLRGRFARGGRQTVQRHAWPVIEEQLRTLLDHSHISGRA